jgi:hypothetical protein
MEMSRSSSEAAVSLRFNKLAVWKSANGQKLTLAMCRELGRRLSEDMPLGCKKKPAEGGF